MPELPEVETVKEALKREVLHRTIQGVTVYYENIIEYPTAKEFQTRLIGQTIHDLKRRGKWILFELDRDYLLSHLRMEGKYFIRKPTDPVGKHEHISFLLDNGFELRYQDTRKFGRMHLIPKEEIEVRKPLSELGLEPWDCQLTVDYLKEKWRHKTLPIKTVLLDQSIIVGIGNIYDNEILFLSKIHPLCPANRLTKKQIFQIIQNTQTVLAEAIAAGGTTIRSYTSSEGVHGRFQHELHVHGKDSQPCTICGSTIEKIKVGGRGTYFCPVCQKKGKE